MGSTSKRKRHSKSDVFSVGELNRLIDAVCHPLFKNGEGYVVSDGVLHGLVERNPPMSVRKFVQYNLPKLITRAQRTLKKKWCKTEP